MTVQEKYYMVVGKIGRIELARLARVSPYSLRKFEKGWGEGMTNSSTKRIIDAVERAGYDGG